MSNTSQQEKIKLEHQAAKLFLRLYEKQFHIPMRHIWHNQPSKPDISCYQGEHQLDIEIAHLYGSEKEAMAILNRELSSETKKALELLLVEPIEQRLTKALQRILANKSIKKYDTKRVWLVIRNANPFWHSQDIQSLQHHFKMKASHPFEQVWIIGDMKGVSGLTQLFP